MAQSPVYRIGEQAVFGLRTEVVSSDDTTDRVIVVQPRHEGRPDLLAYELYGNTELWWVVPEANQMVDPITEMVPGAELRVPSKSRVMNILSV